MGASAVWPTSPLAPAVGNRLSIGEEDCRGKAQPVTPISERKVAQCSVQGQDHHSSGPCTARPTPAGRGPSAWPQPGLFADPGPGILIGGAAAQAIGPQPVVALSGLLGLASATLLAMRWTRRRAELLAGRRARSEESRSRAKRRGSC